MQKQSILYYSPEGDKLELSFEDQTIHEAMKTVVRLLRYIGYSDESIVEGLTESSLD